MQIMQFAGIDRKCDNRHLSNFLEISLSSWFSKKPHSVSTSTAEAEYFAVGRLWCSSVMDEESAF